MREFAVKEKDNKKSIHIVQQQQNRFADRDNQGRIPTRLDALGYTKENQPEITHSWERQPDETGTGKKSETVPAISSNVIQWAKGGKGKRKKSKNSQKKRKEQRTEEQRTEEQRTEEQRAEEQRTEEQPSQETTSDFCGSHTSAIVGSALLGAGGLIGGLIGGPAGAIAGGAVGAAIGGIVGAAMGRKPSAVEQTTAGNKVEINTRENDGENEEKTDARENGGENEEKTDARENGVENEEETGAQEQAEENEEETGDQSKAGKEQIEESAGAGTEANGDVNPPEDILNRIETEYKKIEEEVGKILKAQKKYAVLDEGNIGFAIVKIDREPEHIIKAYSKFNNIPKVGLQTNRENVSGFAKEYPKDKRKFATSEVDGYSRSVDTESKILETFAESHSADEVTGRIYLFTELKPCESCERVIKQFKEMYPGVKIKVITSSDFKCIMSKNLCMEVSSNSMKVIYRRRGTKIGLERKQLEVLKFFMLHDDEMITHEQIGKIIGATNTRSFIDHILSRLTKATGIKGTEYIKYIKPQGEQGEQGYIWADRDTKEDTLTPFQTAPGTGGDRSRQQQSGSHGFPASRLGRPA